jgi:flagellar hook assembly protein FlgD
LYSVKGEVDLEQYEMPPMPPSGMFDIRFSSGRIAEDLSSSQSIEMNSVSYPIKVRVENMNITLQDETGKELHSQLKSGEEVTISDNTINKLTVLSGKIIAPIEYALEQNYPNPFNPSTTIKFSLAEASDVTLTIYNTLGQKVTELVNAKLDAGRYSYQWNASDVATGMYIYEIRADKFVSVKKMILLK